MSLLDLSVTLVEQFRTLRCLRSAGGTRPIVAAIAAKPPDDNRIVLSEYHAVGSNTGAYMLRRGRWKDHHYVRHEPELFDLQDDPEETTNLASSADHRGVVAQMDSALRTICDPELVDREAKKDQAALIERIGGVSAAFSLGRAVAGGTPAPDAAENKSRFNRGGNSMTGLTRRSLLGAAATALATNAAPTLAQTSTWPREGPIRWLVGVPPPGRQIL